MMSSAVPFFHFGFPTGPHSLSTPPTLSFPALREVPAGSFMLLSLPPFPYRWFCVPALNRTLRMFSLPPVFFPIRRVYARPDAHPPLFRSSRGIRGRLVSQRRSLRFSFL